MDNHYSLGSNSSTLTFTYTVQAGDTSSKLDYKAANSLVLNGGTIKDSAGNSLVLTLPNPSQPGSLGFNKNIVIDTTAPTMTITSTTAGVTDGSTTNDATIALTFT